MERNQSAPVLLLMKVPHEQCYTSSSMAWRHIAGTVSNLCRTTQGMQAPRAARVITQGHPGTGKSTLATSLARYLHWSLVDKDDIRDALEVCLGGQVCLALPSVLTIRRPSAREPLYDHDSLENARNN